MAQYLRRKLGKNATQILTMLLERLHSIIKSQRETHD